MPTRANLAATVVATAPSPASSGTTLTVATGKGARFATPPFNATIGPAGVSTVAFAEQAEIVRVTKVTGDELTIVRAFEGPNAARSVVVGDIVAETITVNEAESALAYAPAPSGGDDSKAVQEVYEGMGKAGILQLRAGTYKFDTGIKINKYAVRLRGHGAASMEVESKIVTAGTLITCNSRNKAAIEVSQAGSNFSDFALLNNANLELATLSEELKSSGAAITEIKVNALAEAIPTATRLTTLSGAGPFELGTLSATLSTAAPITSFKVNALASTIPLTNVSGTTKVTLNDGAGHTQVFTLTAEALAGATEIKVESLKPNFAYPLTTTKVEGGSFYQQWVMSAEAAKGATGIKVESLKPNYNYPNAAKVEGGPFPGSYGIISNRLNEKGEETTEGNSRGRYWNLDIEGFNVNWRAIAGFEQRFDNCTFMGGTKYQFQYGDPNNIDAGGLFIGNSTFMATKKRKVAANLRWESGGGVFINNCSAVYDPETVNQIPAIQFDFFFEPPAKHGTTNLTVNACHIEGYENAGVRFVCSSGESVTLGNCAVTGCELRPFTAVANRVGVLAESPASEHLTAVTITGNRFSTEGGSARLKNVNGYNYSGNTGHVAFTLEGSDAAGSGTLGYPSFPIAAASTTMNVSHAGGNNPYWLFIYLQLKPSELAEYQLLSSGYLIATIKEQAPQPLIYGYCEAIAGGEITEIKTKALIFSIPNGANIKVVDFESSAIFTEFKTTAEAKVGETKILVEKKLTEAIPAPSPVEALAPEKYEIVNGPFFMPPTAAFELKRLDTNTYTVKTAKVIAV